MVTTSTWTNGISADWTVDANWTPSGAPNDQSVIALINAAPATGTSSYTVTISAGEGFSPGGVTINNAGATLAVTGGGQLVLNGGALAAQQGAVVLNNGVIINAGSVSGLITGTGQFFNLGGSVVSSATIQTTAGLLTFNTPFINNGTISASGTASSAGTIVAANDFTNNGTVSAFAPAGGADLEIQGSNFSNLSNGTLTGGTYIARGTIAQGQTSAISSQLVFAVSGGSPVTTDAATLILDGPAAVIKGATVVSGSTLTPSIETELRTITAGGSLQLLNGANFADTGTLTDAGLLTVGGGKLSVTGGMNVSGSLQLLNSANFTDTGTLIDSGVVTTTGGTFSTTGMTVSGTFNVVGTVTGLTNAGGTINDQGRLTIPGSIAGTGALSVASGGVLQVQGASATSLANNGTIFNTAGFLNIGSLTGAGTIVVYNGSSIEVGGTVAAGQTINFGGANVTARLDNPAVFGGTLVGFGPGDTANAADKLVLAGITGTGAQILNSNTLSVTTAGSPVNILLAGNYTGATFAVSTAGGATTIVPMAGAPARTGLTAVVTLNDQAGLTQTVENNIITDLQAAVAAWGQYITGQVPLRIALNITAGGSTSTGELADAAPTSSIDSGTQIGGKEVFTPSSELALTTGTYQPNTTSDITVTIPGASSNLSRLFINPTPGTGTVPNTLFDLVSILTHEIGHGLVFSGLANNTTGTIGANIFPYDQYLQIGTSGGTITSASFTGPNAEAAYGAFLGTNTPTPVPLNNTPGSALVHIANSTTDPLGNDLMFASILPGTTKSIGAVDVAIAKDAGEPVTSSVAALACYAAGTRIATPDGNRLVQALRAGDLVRTLDGSIRPVVWAGWRKVSVTRHPDPEKVRPVVIQPDAFGPGLPVRALRLSPDHAVYVDGALIPVRLLVNGTTISIDTKCRTVTYHHIELDRHDIVLAEGLPAESYLETGNRHMYANGGAVIALHADFTARVWEMEGCAPLVQTGPLLDAVRARLAPPRRRGPPSRAKRAAA